MKLTTSNDFLKRELTGGRKNCPEYTFFQKISEWLFDCHYFSFRTKIKIKSKNDEMLLDTLLFGSDKCKDTVNKEILVRTFNFLKTTLKLKFP